MKVYIAQLKCPANHCVMAVAGEFDTYEAAHAELSFKLGHAFGTAVKEKLLNYECGICRSQNLRPEVRATRFTTMAEAMPHLKATEQAQAESAEAIRAIENGAKNN